MHDQQVELGEVIGHRRVDRGVELRQDQRLGAGQHAAVARSARGSARRRRARGRSCWPWGRAAWAWRRPRGRSAARPRSPAGSRAPNRRARPPRSWPCAGPSTAARGGLERHAQGLAVGRLALGERRQRAEEGALAARRVARGPAGVAHEVDAQRRRDGEDLGAPRHALLEAQVGDRRAVIEEGRRRDPAQRVLDAQVDDRHLLGDVADDEDRAGDGQLLEPRLPARGDDAARGPRGVVELAAAEVVGERARGDALLEGRVGADARSRRPCRPSP